MERPSSSDLGLRVVNEIYDLMRIDAQWSVWEPRGFTWWGWHSAQRVWSEPGVDDHGFRLYRLYAATELFDGFENTDEQVLLLNDLTTHMTLSGMVAPKPRPGRIELAASVYVHQEIVDWAKLLFGTAVAMQAAEAAILAGQLPSTKSAGLRPVTSAHPRSGPRPEMDDMLNIFNRVNAEGQSPSRYAGEEMEQLVASLQQPPCVAASGDKMGVTAEFPYPGPVGTSLLQLRTTDKDPRAGNGLFVLLSIPEGKDDAATARHALELNRTELNSPTWTHFLGSWVSKGTLTYAAFYPNWVHRIGGLRNIAMATVTRARWLTEDVMDYSWEEHFQEAVERKLALLKQVSERLKPAAEKTDMPEQSKNRKIEKDSKPKQLNTQGAGKDPMDEELVTKLARSLTGSHAAFRENWLTKQESYLPVEDNSVCPFCGWDCRAGYGAGEECPHLLTELLCDWDDFSPEGTARGTFEHVTQASFGSLNQAVSRFLRASKGDKKRIASITPVRIRRLVRTVARGAHTAGTDVDRSLHADMEGFGQYIVAACSGAKVEVRRTQYDTGDPFGTSPYVFWAADAVKAATEMARLLAKDVDRLKALRKLVVAELRAAAT